MSERVLSDEQCCLDVCNGGACEGCPGCQAGWCVNGHDFSPEEWALLSDEDRQRWWGIAREHNVGIDAALKRAEAAEAQLDAVRAQHSGRHGCGNGLWTRLGPCPIIRALGLAPESH